MCVRASSPPSYLILLLPDAQTEENCKMRRATFPSFIFLRCCAAARLANYPTIRTTRIPYHFSSSLIALAALGDGPVLPFSLLRPRTHRYRPQYTCIHARDRSSPFCVSLLSSPFISTRYKFIPLTFSLSPFALFFSLSLLLSLAPIFLFIFSQRLFWVTHRFASNPPQMKHPPKA